jgi:hypothetical protein
MLQGLYLMFKSRVVARSVRVIHQNTGDDKFMENDKKDIRFEYAWK